MKRLLISIGLLTVITLTSQAQSVSRTEFEDPTSMDISYENDEGKALGFFEQIEQQSERLRMVRVAYQKKLEADATTEEKDTYTRFIENIDDMLRTNERLLSGDTVIHKVISSKSQESVKPQK